MAFWKFGFAQTSAIDTLLNSLPLTAPSTPSSGLESHHKSTALLVTLEQLLQEEELLQECKSNNTKLADFLSRPVVLAKILEYVNGFAFDGFEDPEITEERDKQEQRRRKLPHVCTEILLCNCHLITQELFGRSHDYLVPFWNQVLDRAPQDTIDDTMQLGFWAKANAHFLNEKPAEMLSFIKAQPRLVERMVQHINASPIADILYRMVHLEITPHGKGIIDFLASQQLIPLLVDRLAPSHSTYTHLSVTEFLKGLISYCSSVTAEAGSREFAPPTPANQPPSGQPHTLWGKATSQNAALPGLDGPPIWPSTSLLRDLASKESVSKMIKFTLDDPPVRPATGQEDTPPLASTSRAIELPTTFEQLEPTATPVTPLQATSSLVHGLAILIDLIRKINCDFSEQQILRYLRKQQALAHSGRPHQSPTEGPSVVDLRHLVRLVGQRIGDFNHLLNHPRSSTDTLDTPNGPVKPLTLERFRICELYAELLHCSNMGLLNRQGLRIPTYSPEGFLEGGFDSIDVLASFTEPPPPIIEAMGDTDGEPHASFSSEGSNDAPNLHSGSTSPSTDAVVAGSPAEPSPDLASNFSQLSLNAERPDGTQAALALGGDQEPDAPPPSVGQRLKQQFLEEDVTTVLLDLFFDYPNHNFLHSVVYDLTQQIFNGRIDIPPNRDLCFAILIKSRLPDRILEAQKLNEGFAHGLQQRRLPYMGHLSLMAEEVVKLFATNSDDFYDTVFPDDKKDAWQDYVYSVLRKVRERDAQLLGGGVERLQPGSPSSTGIVSEDEDEFPMSARAHRSRSGSNPAFMTQPEGSSPPSDLVSKGLFSGPGNSPFAHYLASQMHNPLADKFSSSSDSDEEDKNVTDWINSTGFDPKDPHFQLGDDHEDGFGEFSSGPSTSKAAESPYVTKHNLTAADWNSSFKSSFTFTSEDSPAVDPFADNADSESEAEDDDEWGAFSGGPSIANPFGAASASAFDDSFSPPTNSSFSLSSPSAHDQPFDADLAEISSPKEKIRADGLIEVSTDGLGTVIVPPDEVNVARERRHRSASLGSGADQSPQQE